jgi:hypothetical protein
MLKWGTVPQNEVQLATLYPIEILMCLKNDVFLTFDLPQTNKRI